MNIINLIFLLMTAEFAPPNNDDDLTAYEVIPFNSCVNIPADDEKKLIAEAEQGNPKSARLLSLFYLDTVKDKELSQKWLVKSAEMGNAVSQFFLGVHLIESDNLDGGLSWLNLSANQGVREAFWSLYLEHEKSSPLLAQYWQRRAALAGSLYSFERTVLSDDTTLKLKPKIRKSMELALWRLGSKRVPKPSDCDKNDESISTYANALIRDFRASQEQITRILNRDSEMTTLYWCGKPI